METYVMQYTWTALCIAMLVMSGSVTSEEATTAPSSYELTMDITNRIYNDSLLKPGSPDYETLSSQVNDALNSIYGCPDCAMHSSYQKVSEMTFSDQSGTVLVKATLVFQSNQPINDTVIKDMFIKAIGTNEMNGLKINGDSLQVTPIETTTKTPIKTTTKTPIKTTTKTPIKTTTKTPIKTTTKTPIKTTTKTPIKTTTKTPIKTTTKTPIKTTTKTPIKTTTKTPIKNATHPTDHPTTHHNAASSFNQSPITLASFLRYSVSFCLLFLIGYSF